MTKNLFLITFALFWGAISAHCQWEMVPGFDFLKCSSVETSASHCEDDVCADVEEGQFFQIQKLRSTSFDFVLVPFVLLSNFNTSSDQLRNAPRQKSLPDLPVCWQFVYRTALPVRAPSFVS